MKDIVMKRSSEIRHNTPHPVTLFGVIVPWSQDFGEGRASDFKLTCASGAEFFILADENWRPVLTRHCWEDVKVIGLLNMSNMTLVPRKIFPKGSPGKTENVIDIHAWKAREAVKKLGKSVAELVLVYAAVFAVMS